MTARKTTKGDGLGHQPLPGKAQTAAKATPAKAVSETVTKKPAVPVAVVGEPNGQAAIDRHVRREGLRVSREVLSKITGISTSRIWASEQSSKIVQDEILATLDAALDKIAAEGIPAEFAKPAKSTANQVTKADLQARVDQVAHLLDLAAECKTLKEIKALVEQAGGVLIPLGTVTVSAAAVVTEPEPVNA